VDYRLCVDFGTSNTVAVLAHRGADPRPLLFEGSPTLRSAVFLDTNGALLVGRDAERSARTSPDRFEPNPKRRIDEQSVLLGEAEIPVVDAVAAVLHRVATEARRVAGGPIGSVTLTYPAAWGPTRRQVLVLAAQRAGIPPTGLVPEPVAAAHSFLALAGGTIPVGAGILVYDLGAGTFDASVVRRSPTGFEVVASEGLAQGGGLDIDAAIVAYLAAAQADRAGDVWSRLLNPVNAEDRRASRLLWDDVRSAKEQLSRASQTLIHIPLAGDDVPLGREQLERLARPILDATIATTRVALNNAGLGTSGVAGIFLVGGGSRIPLVTTLLHQAFQHAPAITEQPELVVAEGGLRGPAGPVPVSSAPAGAGGAPADAGGAPGGAGGAPAVARPPVGAPQVSAPPVTGPPVSAPPVNPVSAQPVSGYPVSGHPVSGHPVSARPGYPPPQPAYPVSTPPGYPTSAPPAHPMSGPPAHPMSVPPAHPMSVPPAHPRSVPPAQQMPAPFPGQSVPQRPAAAPIQPVQVPGVRPKRTNLVVTGIAAAVVLVLGAVFLVVLLLPDGETDPPGNGDRTASVNRTLYQQDGHAVMLTSVEIRGGKLRVNMRYENRTSEVWNLTCPATAEDLRSSWVTVAGRQVYADDSWCVQTHPGQGVTIGADTYVDSWGRYPVVPERNVPFTLNWYDLDPVTNLAV
jgi:hypothetical protein